MNRTNADMQQELVELLPDAIVVVSRDGRIVRVNAPVETLFGYSRAELLGQPIEALIPERYRERHVEQRAAYASNPYVRPMRGVLKLYGRRQDGSEFPVDIMLSPLDTEEDSMVVAVIRDATERKRAEETLRHQRDELAKAYEQLRELDRLQSKFISDVSHELRTPVANLHLYLSLLERGKADKRQHYLAILKEQVARLVNLVEDITDVSHLELDNLTATFGLVDLNAVAHPDLLFSRLTDGRNLAESFGAASELLLSWMDVIVGDPKFDPYDLAYVPDLEVSVANLTISPTAAVSGALFTADAFVGNLGNYPAENVSVSLFRGDPRTGGTLLSRQVVTVDYGLTSPLAFEWDSLGDSGSFDLCVFADSADDFFEVSEANNIACQAILLDPALSLPLVEGWNLISLPLVPSRPDLPWVFRSIAGDYDLVRAFSAGTVEPWRLHDSARPGPELLAVDPALGLWIHVTRPGGTTLLVGGTEPATTSIPLSPGWNLVGFPAGGPRQAAVAFVGVPVSRVETFDPAGDPYRLRPVGWAEDLMPGQGLWVRADAATTWVVPY